MNLHYLCPHCGTPYMQMTTPEQIAFWSRYSDEDLKRFMLVRANNQDERGSTSGDVRKDRK